MAKPIVIVHVYGLLDNINLERDKLTSDIERKLYDYHVFVMPERIHQEESLELEVYNPDESLSDTSFEELKSIIQTKLDEYERHKT